MVAVQAPVEKTKVYTPVWLGARFTVPRGLARKQYRRVRVNDVSSLWPHSHLRTEALKYAQRFVDDMRKQGYQLLSAEADVLISGPLPTRVFNASGMQKAQRHVLSGPLDNRQPVERDVVPVLGATGVQGLFDLTPASEDFLLEAQFLSTRIRMVEHAVKVEDTE